MSKAGRRRQNKLALYLTGLARDNQSKFFLEWEKRVKGWLYEIHRRGKSLDKDATEETIFGVVEQANRLLELCSPEVESLVGISTRGTLVHESCKVFSLVVSPELYRIYNRGQYLKE